MAEDVGVFLFDKFFYFFWYRQFSFSDSVPTTDVLPTLLTKHKSSRRSSVSREHLEDIHLTL